MNGDDVNDGGNQQQIEKWQVNFVPEGKQALVSNKRRHSTHAMQVFFNKRRSQRLHLFAMLHDGRRNASLLS